MTWNNNLVDNKGKPLPHLLPVDPTLVPAAEYATMLKNGVPIVTHLHGGHTVAASDGTPDQWYTPGFKVVGPEFQNKTDTYSNDQEAATLWYHDHADGITRLNVYAGLAGFYLLRDPWESGLNLPSGNYEVPLAIQDRIFTSDGQLFWPSDILPGTNPPPNQPSIHPEMFGNTILVDGQEWPVLHIEPRKYRLRLLDGSDSRFYNLFFSSGPSLTQIGADEGLLDAPVTMPQLTIAPGERADVIVDFSQFAGKTLILRNNAKAPFPAGTAADPNTVGQIMAFVVDKPLAGIDRSVIPTQLRPGTFGFGQAVNENSPRQLLLFENVDQYNRLQQLIGPVSVGGLHYDAPVTETPIAGQVELWQFFNTTGDVHPIHLHGTSIELVSRQSFSATQDPVTGALTNIKLTGGPKDPAPNEQGPKDTIEMRPGEATTIRVRFDRAGLYVYHCHILSHEEHDMMRPFVVQPAAAAPIAATVVNSVSATSATAPSADTAAVSASIFSVVPAVATVAVPPPTPVVTSAATASTAATAFADPATSAVADAAPPPTTGVLDPLLTGILLPVV